MNRYSIQYLGDLKTKVTHLQSNQFIFTDTPIDNHGEGKFFSPTDLIGASLGSCIMTLVAIQANLLGISIQGSYMNVEKIMKDSPRAIHKILINVYLPDIEKAHRARFEKSALNCPVYHSLNPDMEKNIVFHWGAI